MGVKLLVGLGNPGAKYAGNRHNIGFMAVDRIATDHGFSPWKKAFQGEVSEGRFGSLRVVLLKPGTFMNLSGQSVRATVDFHKIALDDVTVFHDELDLAPGKCRVKQGGGHAGHNGLRSLHAHVGDGYGRVRLGIGHPGHKDRVAGYVLSDFAKADSDWLEDLMHGISDGAAALAAGDTVGFQNAVALRVAPPRSGSGTGTKVEVGGKAARGRALGNVGRSTAAADKEAPAAPPASQADGAIPPDDTRSVLRRLVDRFR